MDQFVLENEWFNIEDIFQELNKIMKVNFKIKNVDLIFQKDPLLQTKIFSDPKRIKQILLNLISNALKFTRRGNVTISVESLLDRSILEEDEQIEEIMLCFKVQDTGFGIDRKNIDKLFELFGKLEDDFGVN